jgi:hypothetical protein
MIIIIDWPFYQQLTPTAARTKAILPRPGVTSLHVSLATAPQPDEYTVHIIRYAREKAAATSEKKSDLPLQWIFNKPSSQPTTVKVRFADNANYMPSREPVSNGFDKASFF